MCGIAGWIMPAARAPHERSLRPMLAAIAHRGPDGEGIASFVAAKSGERVALGHRRLAIIDPQGSSQPMVDARAGLALTFNGEIYNFRELRGALEKLGHAFERDSDTEVLLRAYQQWGPDAVGRLRGQFAFALWDGPRERLFLARDRFGEKPLFLYEAIGGLYFASEIKALLRAPAARPALDTAAMWDCIAYRYVPGPSTLFQGVRKLPPGSSAIWQRGRLQETRYWTPPDRHAWRGTPPGDPVGEFRARLEDTVRLEMVSDVPFGAFLSGGIDSSTIVALMCRFGTQVKTFSVGFAEDGYKYDELRHAAALAARLGTQHHELVVSHRELMQYLPQLVASRDAPVSEPSDIPIFLLAREASRTVKMVLTGEGSDELLGGYRKHVVENRLRFCAGLPKILRQGLLAPLAQALPARLREVKIALASLACADWRERYVRWFGAMNFAERRRLAQHLARPRGAAAASTVEGPPFDADPDTSALRRVLYYDQTSWLPDNLLERGDRMTMAASIEARVPFLEHQLAEFVATLPDSWRVKGRTTKRVLREAARTLLPGDILARPKIGFRVPVGEWLAGEMRDYLFEHLRGGASLTRAYYDGAVLDRLLDEHVSGRQAHDKLLWTLLNLEIWQRQHASGAPQERFACAA
jgi:asparagine synthase (glutamine-hydrolysing)